MQADLPLTRDLVLAGGGHTHALVLRKWAMRPLAGVRVTLIDPGPFAAYSGMLPGHVAGHYRREDLNIDLVRLARAAAARFVPGRVKAMDRAAGTVTVRGRPPIRYDIVSLDIGVTSQMPHMAGFAEHAVPAKPLGPFAERWSRFMGDVQDGQVPPEATVIGAGVAGAELALAMAHRLKQSRGDASLHLVDASTAFPGIGTRAADILRNRLSAAGIVLVENSPVEEIGEGWVRLTNGRRISHAFCCGAAGATAQGWLAATGLELTKGFVRVDETLGSVSDGNVFAVGDCAHMAASPRAKAGVFAVRQAPVLFHNLRAELSGTARRTYRPQTDYLKLVSLGEKSALADRRPLALAGPWLWRLKDRIDRNFMKKLTDLPAMPSPALPREAARDLREELGEAPFCGGCGAKIGAGGLGAVLLEMQPHARPDVLSRLGDDAATLLIGGQRQVITTDHLRAVVEDPWLMARIAAVHAMGDIWAMGAQPQAALATVILPRMRRGMQGAALREITLAAEQAFRAAGADLVGGHSTMGAELTIGFTVTGLTQGPPITLAGAAPGDMLILTRPIGSGVLLAAEMRGLAAGDAMLKLYDRMVRSQADASAILAPVAHAMTDVTGFGLAGHLLAMARASEVAVVLDPQAVPLDSGAHDLAKRGVRSSLHRDNRDAALPAMPGFAETALTDLLLDPQTCGGLLAAIPAARAADVIGRLYSAGETAASVIGRVEAGPPALHPLT